MDYDCHWEGRMQLLVEMAEVMMCRWEDRMQHLVEMAEVMMDDDCRWEDRMQRQVVHLDGEYFEAHPDPSPR